MVDLEGKHVVLAYSGGLDTSVILHWLVARRAKVTAFMANLGQDFGDQHYFDDATAKARSLGADNVRVVDVREEFVRDFVFPAMRANARYEGAYYMGTSLARPVTAKAQVAVAQEVGAQVLSHGATGKGNDQVRFEFAYLTLMPRAEIYAPWKEPEFRARFDERGRDALLAYAEEHRIPVAQSKRDPWSSDENLAHISYEAGILEDPNIVPPERMFRLTADSASALPNPGIFSISFVNGNPVSVAEVLEWKIEPDGPLTPLKISGSVSDPVSIMDYLNLRAGQHGIGRLDMVESRYIGLKSRGVYEAPAFTVLQAAHADLEHLTLSHAILTMNAHASIDLANAIYEGRWFSEEREALQAHIDRSQAYVTGSVTVQLYRGNIAILGRSSPYSLYDAAKVSMHELGGIDPADSGGFIKTVARPLVAARDRVLLE